MTQGERAALVEELRLNDSEIYLPLLGKAADQIEADGKRIAELEAELDLMEQEAWLNETDAAKDATRIAELEATVDALVEALEKAAKRFDAISATGCVRELPSLVTWADDSAAAARKALALVGGVSS